MMKRENYAAYQGRGWKSRGGLYSWSSLGVNSEWRPLRDVLLYKAGNELRGIRSPNAVQHLARIDPAKLEKNYANLVSAYRRNGVRVHFIDPSDVEPSERTPHYNLTFVRDLFFNTTEGSVIARMASRVRAGEERYAAQALSVRAIPIMRTIRGNGTFEGADAVWLTPKQVLCGIGERTNEEGFRQLREALRPLGVKCVAVDVPSGVQHLLGVLQVVDQDLALVREEIISRTLRAKLNSTGFRIIGIPESAEVRFGQGMNIVTLRPRTILMPAGCPGLRKRYLESGLKIAAEVDVSELLNGAGGIACATGILGREPAR